MHTRLIIALMSLAVVGAVAGLGYQGEWLLGAFLGGCIGETTRVWWHARNSDEPAQVDRLALTTAALTLALVAAAIR